MKELAELTGVLLPSLARHLKNKPTHVRKGASRTNGITPGGVEAFLRHKGYDAIYNPGVYLTNSQCGGVSKTTTTIAMAFSYARLSDRNSNPIVILDLDSQASTTLQLLGKSKEKRLVLSDYVEGRVTDLTDLLIPVGDNIFLIPSSLDNAYLEKAVSVSKKVKEVGKKIIADCFEQLSGDGTLKLFIDAPPALSPVTHSFLYGMNTLDQEVYDKVLCLPIRPDDFAVRGCEIALEEFEGMLDTFNVDQNIRVVPFLTFYDKRTKNSGDAMKLAFESEMISKYEISPVVIRNSADVAKKLAKNAHIFSEAGYKPGGVAQDYQDFMLYVMGWDQA